MQMKLIRNNPQCLTLTPHHTHAQTPVFTPSPSSHAACPRCLRCPNGNCTRYGSIVLEQLLLVEPFHLSCPKPPGHAVAYRAHLRNVPLLLIELPGVGLRSLLGKRPRWQFFLPAGV